MNNEDSLSMPAYKAAILQGKAYRIITAHITRALQPFDLSIPEWKLLGQASEHKAIKLAGLAELLSVEAPLVTALVDRLEKKRLVKRTDDLFDKRAKVIKATKKGTLLIEETEPKVKEAMRKLFQGVTQEEMTTYIRVLEVIVKNG